LTKVLNLKKTKTHVRPGAVRDEAITKGIVKKGEVEQGGKGGQFTWGRIIVHWNL